jgi:hypothetical protein
VNAALGDLRAQWQSNRRLRLALGVALVIAAAHVGFSAHDARQAAIAQYQSDAGLLSRLEGAAADDAWSQRAEEAAAAQQLVESGFTRVGGPGEAQAELQARLSGLATSAGFADARVRTEGAAPVEGLADVLEVSARLDASGPITAADGLLRALAESTALVVERSEIRDGDTAQIQLIVRGYFLVGPAPEATALQPAPEETP